MDPSYWDLMTEAIIQMIQQESAYDAFLSRNVHFPSPARFLPGDRSRDRAVQGSNRLSLAWRKLLGFMAVRMKAAYKRQDEKQQASISAASI